jgi:hypothetical protein
MRIGFKIFLLPLFILVIFSAAFFSPAQIASAQATPQMVVTWQAYGSYIPPSYHDKALPNQESKLTASLALFLGGKLIDLSQQTIYWYLNDVLIASGVGKQYIIFSPFGTAPAYLTLKAELPSYNGNILIHEVQIPLISPKAVIEAPHPSGQFSGNPIILTATPYFFYTADPGTLSYVWSVNSQTSAAAENPQTLQLNIDPATPSGSFFDVLLTITDPNSLMSGDDSTNIVYVKQL